MKITIEVTEEQYNFLKKESEQLLTTVDTVIQQLVNIQIEVTKGMENDLTLDLRDI